ncbi:MAG: hypothetical protein D6788_06635 [Planctomycetota bacterium]|nr:MAG: hypothetical protein D6788_06635 [Planctomycetota bacterium]
MERDDDIVTLVKTESEAEAAAIVSLLGSEGIEARMVGDVLRGLRLFPVRIEILVRRADLARARAVLADAPEL